MYKIDRRGGEGLGGVQKSYTRTDPTIFKFMLSLNVCIMQFKLNSKTRNLCTTYVFPKAGQTAEPNGQNVFEETQG